MSNPQLMICQDKMRCQMVDVDLTNRVQCYGVTLEALRHQGAIGLKFEIIDLESVKELQIVCVDDGREVHSAEQLREHLGMGHGQMWLLREDKDLSPLARSVNVDRISPIISKLTTGDFEKNLLVWAKDKQHLKYLEAIIYASPGRLTEGCIKASLSLMEIQFKISDLLHPGDWDSDDDDDDGDIFVEKVVDNYSGSEDTPPLDAGSEGDRKSSESPGSNSSI